MKEVAFELTHRAIKMTNQPIGKSNRLKFEGVNTFVPVVHSSLVYDRSRDWAHCSINKPDAIFQGRPSVVDCIGVDIKHRWAQNSMIPLSHPVTVINIKPVNDDITYHAQLWN